MSIELMFEDGRKVDTGEVFADLAATIAALDDEPGGCVFPGCERRPQWCQAHHLTWWQRDNGRTDLPNLALVCSFHHHRVHDGWTLEHLHPEDPERPPGHTGMVWRATSPDGTLVLRGWRKPVA